MAESEEGNTLFPDERAAERHLGKGAYAGMEFLHVNARTIINTVAPESAVPFRYTINPYRGCSHACVYCFARPTHDYLGLGIGTDFERKIVVKVNAVERLRAELRSPTWGGDTIAMGTNTDPYQHAEGKYHLTRGIVETLAGAGNPFSILTKSTLILRDAALLAAASGRTEVAVSFSVGTLDRSVWSLTEPALPRRTGGSKRCGGSATRASRAGSWWRPCCRGCPTPRRSCARWSRRARRPAPCPSTVWRCTCGARCAATTSTGSRGRARTWSACTAHASGMVPTRTRRSARGWSASCGTRRPGAA